MIKTSVKRDNKSGKFVYSGSELGKVLGVKLPKKYDEIIRNLPDKQEVMRAAIIEYLEKKYEI